MAKTFGAESTADEVLAGIDLSGKRVLVTGVSAGLGVETARTLAAHGATVVGAARDLDKARRDQGRAGRCRAWRRARIRRTRSRIAEERARGRGQACRRRQEIRCGNRE